MENVYHGSGVSGLSEIKPETIYKNKKYVFASTNKVISLIFSRKNKGPLFLIFTDKYQKQSIVERKPGFLEEAFNGAGSVYTLRADNFSDSLTPLSIEVLSEFVEPVICEEYFPSVLQGLFEYEKQGLVTIYRYPDRPEETPLDNSDLLKKYLEEINAGSRPKASLESLFKLYPEFRKMVTEQNGKLEVNAFQCEEAVTDEDIKLRQ